ncbi:hypothetical protein BCR34DRAFT_597992 [Clohesyomyces aquaticus]|uniref:Uncharacterized protein n=1 Tax=Clohesyomyces aquaticus TaxID=1231657 RepID=A0A1Y2A0C1_9PLEO|nr:hypothetical protein BCR34DRAFT_597992 [Clohesyomyces aquaticus]
MTDPAHEYELVGEEATPSEDTTHADQTTHGDETHGDETATKPLLEAHIKSLDRHRERDHLFWTEISWRFTAAALFSTVIVVILDSFSRKGILSRWEKRWFNLLAILFSSLVSLSLGSLLGLLGNMLRWPLLARKLHKPMDVDLILGMANPTGALRLVWYHTIMDRRWSMTTVVVAVYLIFNVVARLSVAAFGLTFDLTDTPDVEYPVKVTDWNTTEWFNQSALEGYDVLNQHCKLMNRYATIGLSAVSSQRESRSISINNATNITGHGLDRLVHGDTVTYSYFLKEYQGLEDSSSKDNVLHSSSRCIARTLMGQDVYEDGHLVSSLNTTSASSPEFAQVLDAILRTFPIKQDDYIWAAPLDYDKISEQTACATAYLYTAHFEGWESQFKRNATLFECSTCLTDRLNERGIGSTELFGSPPGNASTIANLLLRVGVFERVYGYDYSPGAIAIRTYSGMDKNEHFSNKLRYSEVPEVGNDARVGVALEHRLYTAHLAARLPIIAIMGADEPGQLPKVTRVPGATDRPFVSTKLEVEWKKPTAVLLFILLGQIAAIGVVQFLCRKVLVRDFDSYISVARLLKTTVNKVEGRSTYTGEELVEFLESEGVRMRYGARRKTDGDTLEVDLWDDVKGEFPNATYG